MFASYCTASYCAYCLIMVTYQYTFDNVVLLNILTFTSFEKNAGQGRRPGHQTPHPGGIARKRNSCCDVTSCMASSHFLVMDFSDFFFPNDFCAEGTGKTFYDGAERFLPWVWGSPTWQKCRKHLFLGKK